jgi:hypothetical protein
VRKIVMMMGLMLLLSGLAIAAGAETGTGKLPINYQSGFGTYQPSRILRHDIRVILADSRFAEPERLSWLQKSWSFLTAWLKKLSRPKRSVPNRFLTKILQWIGWAGLAIFGILLPYFLSKLFISARRIKYPAPRRASSALLPVVLKSQAGMHAAKGEFREAIRLLYLAGLEQLKLSGLLPGGISLSDNTNLRQIVRTLGPNHPGYLAFKELVQVFQEKWYGLRSCEPMDYSRVTEYLKTIEENMGKSHV